MEIISFKEIPVKCLQITILFRPPLRWRHNGQHSVSNHQPRDCFLNRLFRHRSKKTSKLRVTGLCVGNSPGTGEFPTQMASNAENVSIWWRHHVLVLTQLQRHVTFNALFWYTWTRSIYCPYPWKKATGCIQLQHPFSLAGANFTNRDQF